MFADRATLFTNRQAFIMGEVMERGKVYTGYSVYPPDQVQCQGTINGQSEDIQVFAWDFHIHKSTLIL